MKKAVNLYLIVANTKMKLNLIKKAGYDGVLLGVSHSNETMTLNEQVDYAKSLGLEISMIHSRYIEPFLNDIWKEDQVGELVTNDLISQINFVSNYKLKNFVVHTCGSKTVKNTKIGLERIKRILDACKKNNMNLCIENLYSEKQIDYIFKNIHDDSLKICFDSGHNNFLTPKSKILENYFDKITTTHIHDNHGEKDEHLILGEGNINTKKLAEGLSKCNLEFLTAEIKFKHKKLSSQELFLKLQENLKMLENLDKQINYFKTSK